MFEQTMNKLAAEVIASMKTANVMTKATELLSLLSENPSAQDVGEASDWGINIFREGARKMEKQYPGKDYRDNRLAVEEIARINRASLRGNWDGLKKYQRLNRAGSPWLMNRKMKVGLFVHLVAIGKVPRGY
jgi:hypothetical protein